MVRRMRRLMRLLLLLAAVTTLVPAAIADTGAEKGNAELITVALNLINSDRTSNGVQSVQQSQALSKVAQTYAEYLLRTGFFGHIDPFGRNPEQRARSGIFFVRDLN